MIADLFSVFKTISFNNPKTTDIKFLISRKYDVTILLRKSEGIKSLPNRELAIIYRNDPLGAPAVYLSEKN